MKDVTNQVKTPEDAVNLSKKALRFYESLCKQIDDNAEMLAAIGLRLSIEGVKHHSSLRYVDAANVSDSAVGVLVRNTKHLSERAKRRLEDCFCVRDSYGKKQPILSNENFCADFRTSVEKVQEESSKEAIAWVKRARTKQRYSYVEKNYKKVPKEVRLIATPDVSSSSCGSSFRSTCRYDSLRQLEIALYRLADKPIPERLLGDHVEDIWESECKSSGYSPAGIETFSFECEFFKLRAYRSAPDQITFTDEALALLNEKVGRKKVDDRALSIPLLSVSKAELANPPSKVVEVSISREEMSKSILALENFDRSKIIGHFRWKGDICILDEIAANYLGFLDRRKESEQSGSPAKKADTDNTVQEISGSSETKEAKKYGVSAEAVEAQIEWLERRASLRDKAIKEARLEKARKAQEKAISLHNSLGFNNSLSVSWEYSKRQGFIVSGDTRGIKDQLGRQGLGLSWWAQGKAWYIRGSKNKPWANRYDKIIRGLEAICKAHDITLNSKSELAQAA